MQSASHSIWKEISEDNAENEVLYIVPTDKRYILYEVYPPILVWKTDHIQLFLRPLIILVDFFDEL